MTAIVLNTGQKLSDTTQITTLADDDLIVALQKSGPDYINALITRLNLRKNTLARDSFYNVKDYGALGNGTTNDRVAIQAALDAAYTAGGGTVFMPAGTYGIAGDGTASHGGIRVDNYVTLQGAGMGSTILKVLNSQAGNDLTGVVRTPTGQQTKGASFFDFTIDGNKANVTDRIIGLFLGVTPSKALTVSVVGTTATATTVSGAHGLSSGTVFIFNGTNDGLSGDKAITVTGANTFTFTVTSGTASDPTGYTWYFDSAFTSIADEDITAERVEIKNCQAYGFDPHERVRRLKFLHCISHHNGPDGDNFTLDGVYDSVLEGCFAFDGARNGFNIVTGSTNVILLGDHAWGNAQYGFASQRGSSLINREKNVKFISGSSFQNQHGIRLQMAVGHGIVGMNLFENTQRGLDIAGSEYCTITSNVIRDNGQQTTNTYDEIRISEYVFSADGVTYPSQYNNVSNNTIASTFAKKAKYSINEVAGSVDYNLFSGNIATGAVTDDYIISGTHTQLLVPSRGAVTGYSSTTGLTADKALTTNDIVYHMEFSFNSSAFSVIMPDATDGDMPGLGQPIRIKNTSSTTTFHIKDNASGTISSSVQPGATIELYLKANSTAAGVWITNKLWRPGKQTLYIPASAMIATITNGAAPGQIESSSNKVNIATLDFDNATQEHAAFDIALPSEWDGGTITFRARWSSTSSSTNGVAWGLQAMSVGDGTVLDTAYGTGVVVTDSNQTSGNKNLVTTESAAVTIAGSPAAGTHTQYFRVYREIANVSDTLAADAQLIGIDLFFTTTKAVSD